jgi:hypothetical protein
MQATAAISHRNLDQLEEDIISLSSHINASEYEFLVLVRELCVLGTYVVMLP